MNPHENSKIMSTIEHLKRLMIAEGQMMPGQGKIQVQERNNFDCQSQLLARSNLMDWYAYQSLEARAQFLALDDDPFSVSNRLCYPKLPQPSNVETKPMFSNWKSYQDFDQANQHGQADTEAEMWQLLGKNICQWIMQSNGQPLVSQRALTKMSGVEIACVLLAAHLLKHRQDPKENCMLTHYNCNELRSYVMKSDELQDVLNRCKQRECLTSFYNVIPHRDAPIPSMLPLPPLHWLLPKESKREDARFRRQKREQEQKQEREREREREQLLLLQKKLQVQAEAEAETAETESRPQPMPKPKLKPWQYHPKRYSRQQSQSNGNGGRKRINPNHVLTEVWHPSTASNNYKLYNH
ncbi:uncharacterized protein LOC117791429 [Drosophila innubila]|uniref:uncharacterized protein LOC117791429 n=1 Tax=Drosophila innubila TaxID=198719 RepID=UPI00148DAA20|nr:uncharacterized protein LOC117791429 [Drosophila innubila]